MTDLARFGETMQLPSKLLGRVRVGVGIGAVLIGGCDLVDDAKAEVLGEPVAQAVDLSVEPAESTPEPMLLTRRVGEVVLQARSTTEPPPPGRDLDPPSSSIPSEESAGSQAFVPYDDGSGTLASAPSTVRPKIRPRSRPRPGLEPLGTTADDPCASLETTLAALEPKPKPKRDREWQCPACGRG